jgi:hypothetical protein
MFEHYVFQCFWRSDQGANKGLELKHVILLSTVYPSWHTALFVTLAAH